MKIELSFSKFFKPRKNLTVSNKEINIDCMSILSSFLTAKKKFFRWSFLLITLALCFGLVLSILSWLEICVEHCSTNKDYRLFGLPFALVGIVFFISTITLYFLSQRYGFLSRLVGWMIASALGAEIWFILIQKYEIGHWCPVCLSIAACIATAAGVLLTRYIYHFRIAIQQHNRGEIMQKIKQGISFLSFVLMGFLLAFIGISKFNYAEAAVDEIREQLSFGNKKSPTEIYFVTDWFCPSCKKIEPEIEKIYPKIKSQVLFYFIDYPIHRKSLNYTPYNLAFLINDKEHYFKARDILNKLAEDNDTPNDKDIIKVTKKQGIKFKELSFLDVKAGIDFFDQIVEKYDIKATPTMIITNTKTRKVIKLEGRNEITDSKILTAIEQVQPS